MQPSQPQARPVNTGKKYKMTKREGSNFTIRWFGCVQDKPRALFCNYFSCGFGLQVSCCCCRFLFLSIQNMCIEFSLSNFPNHQNHAQHLCKVLLKDYSSTHRKIQIKQCFMHEDFSIFYESHGVCSYFYICILFTDHHSCENARYSPFVPVKMAHRHFCITVIRRINRIVPLINFSPPFFKSCILIYKLRT